MPNLKAGSVPTSSIQMGAGILKNQGVGAFWRGNMPQVYKMMSQMLLKVTLYDKIKHSIMPNDPRKYSGIDFYWRACLSAVACMGVTTLVTYPLDLIHTRTSVDMTKKSATRLYTTTFDCFNRTNLDEGRFGLYKGVELAVFSALLRACLTLPVYDLVKRVHP